MRGVNHKEAKKRLQELITDAKSKSVRAFALSVNIDPSLLAKVLSDQRVLTDSMVNSISSVYKVNRDWLLYGTGEKYGQNGTATETNGHPLPGSITIQDYKESVEQRIAEIEARRRDAEAMYQDVKQEKGILYDLIKENLTQLLANSNETLKRLEKVLLFDRADHETIMNSQDRAEHLPRGTSTKAAGNLAVQKAKNLRKKGKSHQRDVDM